MLDSYTSDMCMQSWGRPSYARVTVELRADVELKDNIVVAMTQITREGHYTCNRDSYPDNDDYDPYDDDMYENHDFFEHLQSICDDLDIKVIGRKKK
nr:reverse transcriptase domain-containing protein [Tanacetum cinerariifolium]